MKTRVLCTLSLLLCSGCAALEPRTVAMELEHVSHATQHEPFTSHPTGYGFAAANVTARWEYQRAYVELSEGAVLEKCQRNWCGSLKGPREIFNGRVGINLWEAK
jgi:hypothetical protein